MPVTIIEHTDISSDPHTPTPLSQVRSFHDLARAIAAVPRRDIAATALAGVVAALLNMVQFAPYYGVTTHLGIVVALAVAIALGAPAGAAAAAISLIPRSLAGADPCLTAFTIGAVVTVGVCARRRIVPTVAAVGFVVVAGPGIFGLMQLVHDQSIVSTRAIVTGLVLDAVIGTLIADLLLTARSLRSLLTGRRREARGAPLRVHLFRGFVAISAIPLFVSGIIAGRAYARQLESMAAARLNDEAVSLISTIDDYVSAHRQTIVSLAATIEREEREPRGTDPTRLLEEYQKAHPDFITLLVTDRRGVIVSAQHRTAGRVTHAIGVSVADREYFRTPAASGTPFVSGVFRGRGLGNDPIVAISAPLHDRFGRVSGVVEGSLDPSRFARFEPVAARFPSSRLFVVDDSSRVVFASRSAGVVPLSRLDPVTPPSRLAGSARSSLMSWRVVLTEPLAIIRLNAEAFFATVMLVTVGAIALSFSIASVLAGIVTTPIEQLATAVRNFDTNGEPLADVALIANGPREVATLVEDVRTLTVDMATASRSLEQSLAERDRVNQDLSELLGHLDELVQERTNELKLATTRAEHANEAKSRFLATMSHELRTPMNGVIGMLRLLDGDNLTAAQRAHLGVVRQSADALLELLNDLLDYSKIEAGKLVLEKKDFDPLSLARDVVRLMSAKASQRGISLTLSLDGALPARVRGDAARTRQILLNLVDNAVKFTERGSVSVTIGPCPTSKNPNATRFAVADTGIGMSAEQAKRIFQPFTQADDSTTRRFGGTGLGLAICRDLVERMGGHLDVDTAPGLGSTFHYTIPFEAAVGAAPVAEAQSLETPRAMSGCVLVVDDHPINRLVAEATLVEHGLTVRTAASGPEALEILANEHIDLVFMDCRMPEMDGLEATRRIRERQRGRQRTPVVALSAGASAAERAHCIAADMDDFVAKPIEEAQLLRVLDRWLGAPGAAERRQLANADEDTATEAIDRRMLESIRAAFRATPASFDDFTAMLYDALTTDLSELLGLVETGDLSAIASAAHGLAGVALQGGSRRLGDSLVAIESAARDGRRDEVQRLASNALSESRRVIDALDDYLAHLQRATAA